MLNQSTHPPLALGPDTAIHLGADLDISSVPVTPELWGHERGRTPQLAPGRILSVFEYTDTWPYWERHPTGDELVYVLGGEVEFQLDGAHLSAVELRAGQAAIVPAGTWHRAVVRAPSRLLFVTPTPQRTQQRPVREPSAHAK